MVTQECAAGYSGCDGVLHPRPLHLAWHGLTLPHDHPFWDTHFAPNGWGCQCRITSVTKREGEASARAGLGNPPDGWSDINPKTGAAIGIDKGFGYAPGANVDTSLRQMVQDKLITYPDAITRALTLEMNRFINASLPPATFAAQAIANPTQKQNLWLGFVDNYEEVNSVVSTDVKGYMVLLPSDAVRHVENSHALDNRSQRQTLPADYSVLNRGILVIASTPRYAGIQQFGGKAGRGRKVTIPARAGQTFSSPRHQTPEGCRNSVAAIRLCEGGKRLPMRVI